MVLLERFWPLIELHSGRCCTQPATPRRTVDTLYTLSVRALVRSFANEPRGVRCRLEIERLPPRVRLDVLHEMCDHPPLVEVLFQLLSDPAHFSDLLRCVPLPATKLVSCLQWLESGMRSLPERLAERYRQLANEQTSAYRCGLRIGTFLADAGWCVPAAAILERSLQQTGRGSPEELIVLTQLLRTLARSGKLQDADHMYHRIKRGLMWGRSGAPPELMASVYHSFSLHHYERQEVVLSYLYGVQSLELLGRSSPTRLVWDVLRQLARACLAHRYLAKARLLLEQALALAATGYGQTSAPYAETLEDYGVYLLARQNRAAADEAVAAAQHIYLQLYGARNLLLAFAQGSLTYALCRQAVGMASRAEALAHVTERLAAFERTLGPDHRLVVQLRRLLVTVSVILCQEDQRVEGSPARNATTGADGTKLRNMADNPLPIADVRKAFHRCQESMREMAIN